jgi:hypothetical protein
MDDRYPLTADQLKQTIQDVAAMVEQAEEIARLMVAAHGETDQQTIRAQEAHAALVRLQVELARGNAASA